MLCVRTELVYTECINFSFNRLSKTHTVHWTQLRDCSLLQQRTYIYTYIYIYSAVCTYIYIYIYKETKAEREREREEVQLAGAQQMTPHCYFYFFLFLHFTVTLLWLGTVSGSDRQYDFYLWWIFESTEKKTNADSLQWAVLKLGAWLEGPKSNVT